jgi:short-subunit dehydrogenase
MNYQGMTALVTGASVGLGEAFARQLAAQGANLVLVARSEDKLNRLADTLRRQAKVEVAVIRTDLSSAESVDHLLAEVRSRGIRVDLLVNNAGLGRFENFIDTSVSLQMEQVNVNVLALVRLTHAFLPEMIAARKGGVINIASNAAFQPLAGADLYAASKAFILFFSEGLSLELEKTGVHILAACPGPVATQFFANMNPKLQPKEMDQPAPIVNEILRAFDKGKRVVIPGKLLVRLGTLGARLLPRNVILRLAAGTVQQLNQKPRALPQVPLSESDGLPAPIQEPFIQAIQPLRAPEQASFQIPAGGQRISIEIHD